MVNTSSLKLQEPDHPDFIVIDQGTSCNVQQKTLMLNLKETLNVNSPKITYQLYMEKVKSFDSCHFSYFQRVLIKVCSCMGKYGIYGIYLFRNGHLFHEQKLFVIKRQCQVLQLNLSFYFFSLFYILCYFLLNKAYLQILHKIIFVRQKDINKDFPKFWNLKAIGFPVMYRRQAR